MNANLLHLRYLCRHKYFVLVAGRKTGAPLWRLIIHDWSKFSRAEWSPYVNRFFANRSGVMDKSADPLEFHVAWTHHWHRNAHHWEYWITAEHRTMPMPDHFVREMVADWAGAGRAITGKWEVAEWYDKNRSRMKLDRLTRTRVEGLIARFR